MHHNLIKANKQGIIIMNDKLNIPTNLVVGFNSRKDTYSGKLAYVVYKDHKGVLRKEKSWSGWKDDKIPVEEYVNEPTSGFVLNKKAGGDRWGWNPRQTYCRVYDPLSQEPKERYYRSHVPSTG